MSSTSGIEWTGATWNPVVGCTPVSPGCLNCYAATLAGTRLAARSQYQGLTVKRGGEDGRTRVVFSGTVRCLPERLTEPLHWRAPRMIFVNSMSDLFHEDVPFEFIAAVYGIAATCQQHTMQVLTKRPDRAAAFYRWMEDQHVGGSMTPQRKMVIAIHEQLGGRAPGMARVDGCEWPLRNLWLGTSAEDQKRLEERDEHLKACPAAVRFLSLEPLLGPIDIDFSAGIDWVIVGGEGGAHARPCQVEWIRSIVRQCEAAEVPCFVKQMGSKPEGFGQWMVDDNEGHGVSMGGESGCRLDDRRGGDPREWPPELQVRRFPGWAKTAEEHAP